MDSSSSCDDLSYCLSKCEEEYPEFPESAKVRRSRFVPMVFDREGGVSYDGAYYDSNASSSSSSLMGDYDHGYNEAVEEYEMTVKLSTFIINTDVLIT